MALLRGLGYLIIDRIQVIIDRWFAGFGAVFTFFGEFHQIHYLWHNNTKLNAV